MNIKNVSTIVAIQDEDFYNNVILKMPRVVVSDKCKLFVKNRHDKTTDGFDITFEQDGAKFYILCEVWPQENKKSYSNLIIGHIETETKNRIKAVYSYLGQGATCGDFVKDATSHKGSNQWTALSFGRYLDLSRKDLEALSQLAADGRTTKLWFEQMENWYFSSSAKHRMSYQDVPDLSEKILSFTKKNGRPPVPGRLFGNIFPDETITGEVLTVDLFNKKLPLFTNVLTNDKQKFRFDGYTNDGCVDIDDTFCPFRVKVGDEDGAWLKNDNPFLQMLKDNNIAQLVNDKRIFDGVLDKTLYFFCANHTYDEYWNRHVEYTALNQEMGVFIEGLLSKGKFDLKPAERKMISDILSKSPSLDLRVEQQNINKRIHHIVVLKDKKNDYVLAAITPENNNVRIFAERFVLGGIDALKKEKVLNYVSSLQRIGREER